MLDIRAICREHGIPLIESGHHHTHRGWAQLHCPFCGSGRSGWHLGFNLSRGSFHCWRCGGKRVWDVLVKILGSEGLARRVWGQHRSDSRPTRVAARIQPRTRTKAVWTPPGMECMGKPHHRYLRSREFDPEKLEHIWGLKATWYASPPGWRWRVIFPVHDREGRLVGYGGRAIHASIKPKYKMPYYDKLPVEPDALLYGIHLVERTVVVVEGPADVWRLGPGAVASLGVDWSVAQARALKDIPRRFIMFDPDRAAQQRARKLANYLAVYDGETTILQDMDVDPGDLPQEVADSIMKELIHER